MRNICIHICHVVCVVFSTACSAIRLPSPRQRCRCQSTCHASSVSFSISGINTTSLPAGILPLKPNRLINLCSRSMDRPSLPPDNLRLLTVTRSYRCIRKSLIIKDVSPSIAPYQLSAADWLLLKMSKPRCCRSCLVSLFCLHVAWYRFAH